MSQSQVQPVRGTAFYVCLAVVAGLALSLVSPRPSALKPRVSTASAARSLDEVREYSESVQVIETVDDWSSSLKSGRFVLFVDCDWNGAVVAFRPSFSAFAEWCRDETNYRAVSVKMIASSDDQLSNAVQDVMRANEIPQGGLKTYGGAGRIIWLEDGRVLDYDWCHEFQSEPLRLISRSLNVFQ